MKKICIIIPYFGRWPTWFDIYLETCKYNPTINWVFYCDCGKPKNHPQNTEFSYATIKDFALLALKKLGFKINIKNYYKLCDLKPAYGVIFEDYLKGYDFWGYGDIDIIYGDIRKFVTDDILKSYDIISARKEYLAGHFTLFKNSAKINRLYENSADYKSVLQNQKHYNFAECNFEWNCMSSDNAASKRKTEVESMTHVIRKLIDRRTITVFLEGMAREDWELKNEWKFRWEQGKLISTSNSEQILYFHFRKLKYNQKFLIPKWYKIPGSFFITENGIFYGEEMKGVKRSLEIFKNYLRIKIDLLLGFVKLHGFMVRLCSLSFANHPEHSRRTAMASSITGFRRGAEP